MAIVPQALRARVPARLKDSESLRSAALGVGLIPPRPMQTEGERALLRRLVAGRRVAVELGTYEGSSAVVLAAALPAGATLHLVDAYEGNALLFGWQGSERATKRLMRRAVRDRGGEVEVVWHVARTGDVALGWSSPIDLLFIDADHTEAGARADWDGFSPHVVPGGVVAFHDARAGHPGGGDRLEGPTAVVDALFRGPDAVDEWRIVDEVDSIVAVERLA